MKLLILGGTADAVALARAAAGMAEVTYSLAGVTQNPRLPACRIRKGGFGGAEGLAGFLEAEGFDLLLDATHPFAANIAVHAARAAEIAGVSRLKFLRPPWTAVPGDHWVSVSDTRAAAQTLIGLGHRVFLTVGARDLGAFAHLSDTWFLVRLIAAPADPIPLAGHERIVARGPFNPEAERVLFARYGIDVLVSRNSGGDAVSAKLTAARDLSIPVVMIERPIPPPGEILDNQDDVIARIKKK